MNIKNISIIVILSVVSCFAIFQFDTKGYYIFSEDSSGAGGFNRQGFKLENQIKGIIDFSTSGLSLLLDHRFDGSTVNQALPERTLPLEEYFSLGLQYSNDNIFFGYLNVSNNLLFRAPGIRPPYFKDSDSDTTMTMYQKMINSATGGLQGTANKFFYNLDGYYTHLNYNLESVTFTTEDTIIVGAADGDLWMQSDAGIELFEDFRIAVGYLFKHDLNEGNAFNLNIPRIGAEGFHNIKMKKGIKLFLKWHFYEHYRYSESVYLQGSADGLATDIYLNPVFKLRKKMYLKGVLKFDWAEDVYKQWYEFSFRKAWTGGTGVEAGGWITLGTVFPRLGGKVNAAVVAGKWRFHPDIQFFMRMDDTNSFQYYRTTATLESTFNLTKKTELTAGYTHTQYNHKNMPDIKPFTSRGSIYMGIRKW